MRSHGRGPPHRLSDLVRDGSDRASPHDRSELPGARGTGHHARPWYASRHATAQPARYDELLQLETTLASVGRVKVEHSYRLLRGEDVLVTGATTLACLDETGQARMLPDMLLAPQPDSD